MDTVKMQSLAQFQNWPSSIYILIIAAVATLIAHYAWRPSFPKKAPKLVAGGWPILGMLRFFNDRRNFFNYGIGATKTGNFSFYWGKLQIVGMSGLEGRKTFFESKDLNMAEGYAVLFAASPSVEGATGPGDSGGFTQWFSKTITRMMKKENFVKNLPVLVEDTQTAFGAVVARNGGTSGIMDPFDDVYRIVYQLTMRTVGATEIAESPAMLAKTLRLFEEIEKSTSPTRIVFPWLPTVNYFKRMITGARLYYTFSNIAQARKKSGKREDDALQYLLDTGEDIIKILAFVLGALFAGQLNSGINAAWMFAFLAHNPEWKAKVRAEVDSVVARHRAHPGQKPLDVLKTLTIEEWEGEFPLIDVCLRECIRFTMVGTAFRKNLGGRDVPIGNSGEVVPKDAFGVYLIDDTHFNPSIYTDPYKWDPGRFLPERAEDKKQPLSYLGWGIGRHPCLGMRFAKLEMGIIGACFIAMFDYEVVDANGKPFAELPQIDRSKFSAHKPNAQIRLKYQVREGAI